MFSVIMPVWNRANIAFRAIESVIHQTYPDYELIIIDDGSVDNLKDVVYPYLNDHVLFHRISHSGVCAARNFGIERARGEYIAYLDSDNIWHPNFLSVMGNALIQERGRIKAAYCKYHLFKFIPVFHTLYHRGIKGEPFNFGKLLTRNYIDLNTFIHSRECIEKVGFFDEALTSLVDWDYIIRITAQYKPLFVPQVLVNYYLNICDNSIAKLERRDLAYRKIRKKNMAFFAKNNNEGNS